MGGGNTVQSVEQYFERNKPQETYSRKMEEIKKSIFQPKEDYTEYDETIPWEQGKHLPVVEPPKAAEPPSRVPIQAESQQFEF